MDAISNEKLGGGIGLVGSKVQIPGHMQWPRCSEAHNNRCGNTGPKNTNRKMLKYATRHTNEGVPLAYDTLQNAHEKYWIRYQEQRTQGIYRRSYLRGIVTGWK